MPFKSKAQQRFMFAAEARGEVPKGTARRWAHHTKDMKKLPEHVKKDDDKKAFVAGFVTACVRDGLTPEYAVKVAEAYAAVLEKAAAEGPSLVATAATTGGDILTRLGLLGTVGLPALVGTGAGLLTGSLRNEADRTDLEAQKRLALARAYRRRADGLGLRRDLAGMQEAEPGRFVPLG